MKKLLVVLLVLLFSVAANNIMAQKASMDYFAGKWNVLLKNLPQGDTKMILILDKNDTSLSGSVKDTTGNEISKLSKVELTDTSITVYFTAQGYDVNLVLNKKDDDHASGSLMNMFDADADRIKQKK